MYRMFYSSTQHMPKVIFLLIKVNVIQSIQLILYFTAFSVFVALILRGHLTVLLSLSIQLSGTIPAYFRVPSLQTAMV